MIEHWARGLLRLQDGLDGIQSTHGVSLSFRPLCPTLRVTHQTPDVLVPLACPILESQVLPLCSDVGGHKVRPSSGRRKLALVLGEAKGKFPSSVGEDPQIFIAQLRSFIQFI